MYIEALLNAALREAGYGPDVIGIGDAKDPLHSGG